MRYLIARRQKSLRFHCLFVYEYQILDHMLTADAMLREANMGMLDKLKIVALVEQVKGTIDTYESSVRLSRRTLCSVQ